MKIHTKYHGEIDLLAEDILTFEKGIPGFVDEKRFILLPLTDDGIYQVLQSVSTSQLAFVLTSPFNFYKEYDFKLDDSVVEELELKSEKDVTVYSILTVADPFERTTANLQAPVIINMANHRAKQWILNDAQYKTKHPVFSVNKQDSVKG